MKTLKVGLKTGDLVGLDHRELTISSRGLLLVGDIDHPSAEPVSDLSVDAGVPLQVKASGGKLLVTVAGVSHSFGRAIAVRAQNRESVISLVSHATASSPAKPAQEYLGELQISAFDGRMRLIVVCDLETYVQGVLQSEVPSYFHLEAMQAQAVVARTYGIRPRLSHTADGFDVCDSYLHCQAFYGVRKLTELARLAIARTANLILTYQGQPALAMFSACAGGHTEDYENCFSDPLTNAFPPQPIAYLKGVAEGVLPGHYPSEAAMRELFNQPAPSTDDAWSIGNFRFQVKLTADALEAHMHHVVQMLQSDPQFSPFIDSGSSSGFGHIKHFKILKRGVAGTAMQLVVETTAGTWQIEKELTIRSLFQNPDLKLKRLRSARIFFDHENDQIGLLKTLVVSGFGSGHGVGMQQIGAQGLAKQGLDYKRILAHYYTGAAVSQAI